MKVKLRVEVELEAPDEETAEEIIQNACEHYGITIDKLDHWQTHEFSQN